jgi:hypothetical protein
MKNSDIYICALIETKMNEIIDIINQTDSVLEGDPQYSKLRILDWILYYIRFGLMKNKLSRVT